MEAMREGGQVTPDDHLDRIIAKCREVIELGEKRTQGEWREGTCNVWQDDLLIPVVEMRHRVGFEDGRRIIPLHGDTHEAPQADAAFIAACAGPAEAAARSTIDAIAYFRDLAIVPQVDASDDMHRAWSDLANEAVDKLAEIRAAWPIEIL